MKILFMGTPDFAVFSLKALYEAKQEIVAVVTQPDKPKGRGYQMMPPPVKVAAEELSLPVYQPNTLKDEAFSALLEELAPELIVVVAYGKILPKSVLDFPKHGCINVHGSLLPEYRGAAPMQRAILDGKTVTGITTMMMDVGLDTGDMLLREELPMEENDNFETIHDKLGALGADLIVKTVAAEEVGTLTRIPQNDEGATYAQKITKEDCLLDFSRDARTVHNQIRGLSPIPLSFTHTPDGKLLKVTSAKLSDETEEHKTSGEVLSLDSGITVACGRGSVTLLGVLPEGKSRMSAADFIRGRKLSVGDILK
ncbi:MAG: methionyl-tRNA formyltransferase [Clostridia bacterium]|nr:methionyl-tRNA formyltransferase [Clostridia bacterium]